MARTNLGSLDWDHQQTPRSQQSVPEQNALDNQGGGRGDKGHGQHREGEERTLMLAKVHCHCKKYIVALKQQQAIMWLVVSLFGSSHY